MPLPEPFRAFFYAYESLSGRAHHTPWGLVTTDPTYPRVYDANKAMVLEPAPDLGFEDIAAELSPLLAGDGIAFEHYEFMDLSDGCPALDEARQRSGHVRPDVVMAHEGGGGPPVPGDGSVEAIEITEPDEDLWRAYRETRNDFGETMTDEVIDQLVRRDRDLFAPAGQRLFAGFVDGHLAGFTSLISLAGAGYIDNVVTLPPHRRLGVATTLVTRAVAESLAAQDQVAFLLAEMDRTPQRLYERLGFRVVRRAAGFTFPRAGLSSPGPERG